MGRGQKARRSVVLNFEHVLPDQVPVKARARFVPNVIPEARDRTPEASPQLGLFGPGAFEPERTTLTRAQIRAHYRKQIRTKPEWRLDHAVEALTLLARGPVRDDRTLDPEIPLPALCTPDRFQLTDAHGALFRRAARDPFSYTPVEEDREGIRRGPRVTVIDLDQDVRAARALLASVALTVQFNKKNAEDLTTDKIFEGLIGEALTDAYFASRGHTPVAGGLFRDTTGYFQAHLVNMEGIDHLYRTRDGSYVVADSKSVKGEQRLKPVEELSESNGKAGRLRQFSAAWVQHRVTQALDTSALSSSERKQVLRMATARGASTRLPRVLVVTCVLPDDRADRLPDIDGLWYRDPDGLRRAVADEVVILRVRRLTLLALPQIIKGARLRDLMGAYTGTTWSAGDDEADPMTGLEWERRVASMMPVTGHDQSGEDK